MRDFLPVDVRKRNYVIGIIKEVYESYGFEPLETPAVENIETLMGKYGDEGNQLIFKVLKRGEKLVQSAAFSPSERDESRTLSELADLALRYDLTVPLARVVANNKNDLPKFFKRYQIQPVWRADRPARGRFREFYQCDVDAIGSGSMVVEAELISAVSEVLKRLGFLDFTIRINHRQLLEGMLEGTPLPKENYGVFLVALDKLDKIGSDGVVDELTAAGVPASYAEETVFNFQRLQNIAETHKQGLTSNVWNQLMLEAVGSEAGTGLFGLKSLQKIVELCESASCSDNVRLDFTLVRGLSYYTGTIMEINVPDLAGSLGGGGRYDGLIGMFGKEEIPACGFSLGLERILVVMEERGMFPPEIAESRAADVMFTIWNEDSIPASLKLAAELRSSGLRVTVYPDVDKLGKQFKYADSIGVPFVCVVGDDEIKAGKVKLKNMKTGEELTLSAGDIASKIK